MKTIEVNYYQFKELPEASKEKAIENWREITLNNEFAWADEWIESIKKGLYHFDAELSDYQIDYLGWNQSSWKISVYEDLEITGQRLRTYLLNNYYSLFFEAKPYGEYKKRDNDKWGYTRRSKVQFIETSCPFTGYCGDEYFMDTFREFIKNPDNRTFYELLEDAVSATIKGLNEDCEHQLSDEYIIEVFEATKNEFTANGELV